ncbi:hypothetical protein A2154_02785 [Candidatus Gottesmanbacteria bacterium RBG_16_43_7]|uniref:Transposase IS200-like domain-containing protein n=1 Tax=Candidatus Gottesmanbacteria bacterium RBG_16_43_7 TaxID=1798373 RepID=A0A1F5Z9U0_9BACT|nr:MAG: hypothetical protein A2154_02785 [Candidatus Gottesmanbacteria bacterium RBG_16_43_7]
MLRYGHMPRGPRLLLSHSYYHIITRGNNGNTIFRFDIDYLYYLEIVNKYKKEHPFNLYHYCLMPNHVHMLVQTKKSADFSVFMKKLNLSYYHHYRKNYSWTGHFWQNRFKSQPVGKDSYFIQCGKYIELNPVRANLVTDPSDYYYTSYNYYAKSEKNSLITPDFFYEGLAKTDADKQNKYADLVLSSTVVDSYKKKVWGASGQRYNEVKKIQYHQSF